MTAPTHAIMGLSAVVTLGRTVGIVPSAVGLLLVIIGGLMPDIDGRGSITKPGKLFYVFLGRKLAKLVDALFSPFAKLVNLIFGHRGFIHAPALVVLFIVIAFALQSSLWLWFALGYAMHLLGDGLTSMGVPIFSPISEKKYRLANLQTGGHAELAIAIILLIFTLIFGWELLPLEVQRTHQELLHRMGI